MAGLCQARLARKERARPDYGQLSYSAAIDNCLWDILGKAVGLPVYRILGAYKERVRAYASSQHLATVDAFVADVKHAQADGFTAYKIHPPGGPSSHDYKLDMEVIKAVRQTGGDKMALLYDPVGVLTRHAAARRIALRFLRRRSQHQRHQWPNGGGVCGGRQTRQVARLHRLQNPSAMAAGK
jgi:L-alanine-DL-glutamate epimerase-like enolase superfamily enzyme